MALYVETTEPPNGQSASPTIALAHGFTQNARCWGSFGSTLANEMGPVLAVDLPGHGRSGHDEADLSNAAHLTAEAIVGAGGATTWVGYSMGGRVLLHAALAAPAAIDRLVLIGATPGIVDPAERSDRRAADAKLADRLTSGGLDSFLDFWLDLPLFAGLSDEASARRQRLTNRPEGLAASLRNCGTGTQEPLWDRLAELAMPVLVMAGERDQKFRAIGSEMAEAIGANAQFTIIEGAGHACHLEDPEATVAAILNS